MILLMASCSYSFERARRPTKGGVSDEALVFPRLGCFIFGRFGRVVIILDDLLESRSTKWDI
jgi:hypothetical protein